MEREELRDQTRQVWKGLCQLLEFFKITTEDVTILIQEYQKFRVPLGITWQPTTYRTIFPDFSQQCFVLLWEFGPPFDIFHNFGLLHQHTVCHCVL